jgi:hypothetical protein
MPAGRTSIANVMILSAITDMPVNADSDTVHAIRKMTDMPNNRTESMAGLRFT